MAPESYGKAVRPAATNHDPPPSTLAAQIVGEFHTSSGLLRPVDVVELEQLAAAIERVNNNPNLLQTDEERINHNHTLIYVCGGVYLDNLKWQDPFADLERLRDSALRAIRFLDVAIRETPRVLKYTTDGTTFLLRGREPLWLWMLPKVLRMLGHRNCKDLLPAIEALFQHIMLVTAREGSLWQLGISLMHFLQANLAGEYCLCYLGPD